MEDSAWGLSAHSSAVGDVAEVLGCLETDPASLADVRARFHEPEKLREAPAEVREMVTRVMDEHIVVGHKLSQHIERHIRFSVTATRTDLDSGVAIKIPYRCLQIRNEDLKDPGHFVDGHYDETHALLSYISFETALNTQDRATVELLLVGYKEDFPALARKLTPQAGWRRHLYKPASYPLRRTREEEEAGDVVSWCSVPGRDLIPRR